MVQQSLQFDKNNLLFLLLNIVGHDPIHDFGKPDDWFNKNDDSIKKSVEILRQFKKHEHEYVNIFDQPDAYLGGDSHGDTDTESGPPPEKKRKKTVTDTTKRKRTNFNHMQTDGERISKQNAELVIIDHVETIKCTILFNFFESTIIHLKSENIIENLTIDDLCCMLMKPKSTLPEKLSDCIYEKLYNYFLNKITKETKNNEVILNGKLSLKEGYIYFQSINVALFSDVIMSFLETEYIKDSLFHFFPLLNGGSPFNGGEDDEKSMIVLDEGDDLALSGAIVFVTEINQILDENNLNKNILKMKLLLKGYFPDQKSFQSVYTNDEINRMSHSFVSWQENWHASWKEMDRELSANMEAFIVTLSVVYNNDDNYLPWHLNETTKKLRELINEVAMLLKNRGRTSKVIVIPDLLVSIGKIITKNSKDRYDAYKQIRTVEKKNAREKKFNEKPFKMSKDTKVDLNDTAGNFMAFISKSALYLTGICDSDGKSELNSDGKNKFNSGLLKDQIDILRSQISVSDKYWNKSNKSKSDFDKRLFDVIRTNMKEETVQGNNVEGFLAQMAQSYGKIVINNAAIIHNDTLKNNTFCPYTSILDGMPNCSFEKEKNNGAMEYGNMDFKIHALNPNDSDIEQYYRGRLTIPTSDGKLPPSKVKVELEVKLDKITFTANTEVIGISSKRLDRPHVLKNTLLSIIEKIKSEIIIDEKKKNKMKISNDIFQYLFDYSITYNSEIFFKSVFNEILLKGAGDIFQEINSVAKNGGYSGEIHYTNNKIVKLNYGAPRCFVANDRVSISRFLFIKKYGQKVQTNEKSFGGYVTKEKFAENNVCTKQITTKQSSSQGNSSQNTKKRKRGGGSKMIASKNDEIIFNSLSNKSKNIIINIINKRNTKKKYNDINNSKNITINIIV